jgi:hypothetical protein
MSDHDRLPPSYARNRIRYGIKLKWWEYVVYGALYVAFYSLVLLAIAWLRG